MKFYTHYEGAARIEEHPSLDAARATARHVLVYDHRNIKIVRIYEGHLREVEVGKETGLKVDFEVSP